MKIALLWLFEPVGRWFLTLRGYNECFRDAIHFFPAGADRVMPDLYPILLHVLIAVNRTLSVLFRIRG